MDCPVCKYPNPTGVTHCGMCYEVFNRSAAQAYLHAVKRDRQQTEEPHEESETIIQTQHVLDEVKAVTSRVDWGALSQQTISLLKRSQKALILVAGLVVLWVLASFLFSASLWYHLFGKKIVYAYPQKTPYTYLVGLKMGVKSWSERRGRLDTPLEEYKVDEIGNVILEKKKGATKNTSVVTAHAQEWIQFQNDASGSRSHAINKKHPSLAEGQLIFNKKGLLLERRAALSPRVSKSLPFLSPLFPSNKLRHGRKWTEEVEWLDVYNDWQIKWTGTLHWTLGELEPCRENTCAKLTYTADLVPHLRAAPSWAQGGVHQVEGTVTAEGQALFDVSHKRLVSNMLSYDGLLHIPIDNLARIPWDLRIGRAVRAPGDILIRFENKIDIQKN